MGSEVSTLPDETVQYVDQRQAQEILGVHYDDVEFLQNSKGGLYPLTKIRACVDAHNKKVKAEAAEKARLASLPKTPAVCMLTKTVKGNAGDLIPVTDERVQFIGRGLIGKAIQCSLVSPAMSCDHYMYPISRAFSPNDICPPSALRTCVWDRLVRRSEFMSRDQPKK